MTTVFEGKMLIDGELVESVSGERFDSVNPVNEELIGTVPRANADDVDEHFALKYGGHMKWSFYLVICINSDTSFADAVCQSPDIRELLPCNEIFDQDTNRRRKDPQK